MNGAREGTAVEALCVLSDLLAGRTDAACRRLETSATAAERFTSFVDRWFVAGHLRNVLENSAASRSLPAEWMSMVQRAWNLVAENNLRVMIAFSDVAEALSSHGVDAVVIKGPHLACRFYGGLERRPFGDIDVLVPPEQGEIAGHALTETGFRRLNPAPFGDARMRRILHAFDYRRFDLAVDLHWALTDFTAHRGDLAAFRARTGMIALGERSYRVPDDIDALFISVLGAFRDAARGRPGLRQFIDIHTAIASLGDGVDWDEFFRRAGEAGASFACARVLAATLALFGTAGAQAALAGMLDRRLGGSWRTDPLLPAAAIDPGAAARRFARTSSGVGAPAYTWWWMRTLPVRVVANWPNERARRRWLNTARREH